MKRALLALLLLLLLGGGVMICYPDWVVSVLASGPFTNAIYLQGR